MSFAEEYSHRVFRTEDGLPQNRIQAITQTKDGYLWIGTSEGLARFDGVRFVVFDRSSTSEFQDNSILSLEPSPDGSLWIGTEGGGLLHYAGGAFHAFGPEEGLTNGFVRAVQLDWAGDLWAGTDRGFFRFVNGRFTRLDNTPDIPLASVLSMAEDKAGTMWVATFQGLLIAEKGHLVRAQCGRSELSPPRAVSLLRQGLLADGCGTPAVRLPEQDISSMLRDSGGNLWIGTFGQGLMKLREGAVSSYRAPEFLPENTVFTLFEDNQRNIWVGGLDGLVRFGQTAVATIGARDGLKDENITSTYEDRHGRLWILTSSGQIYRLKGTVPEPYELPAPVRDVKVRSVFDASDGSYWFGSAGAGVIHQLRDAAAHYTVTDGLRSNTIRQILEGPDGNIWIATGSGISRWDGHAFTSYYLPEGLSYPSVRCLAVDSNGDILAGTDGGLNRIHNGRLVADSLFQRLRQERIWSILADSGVIWLGTRGGGLVRVGGGKVSRVTAQEGLASNSIYQIVDDWHGSFWMSSPSGVFSVRRKDLTDVAAGKARLLNSVAYGTSDGMETSQMSGGIQPVGCRGPSGDIWFASVRGAVRIDPQRLPEQKLAPVLIEKVAAGETGRGKLQIDYTACNLTGSRRLSFTYKLEGFDEGWTGPSKLRSAYYSNLPPGRYRFRVVAADAGIPGATSEASAAIYLKPAFYQAAWFDALLAAGFIGIVWAGLWGYAHQTKTRFALLLNERTRLAREMHDTVIQGCIGVSTLLEASSRSERSDKGEARQLLDHARAQIKATIEEARQAVWDLRHSVGDGAAISNLFELARKLGEEHATKVDTSVEGSRIRLGEATCQAMLLVGREALRNAVIHGSPRLVKVRIAFGSGKVRMEIVDDGRGFEMEDATRESLRHYGIVGMRERVEQLGGEFTVRSRPGEGTAVIATLPASRTPRFRDAERQPRPESGR